MNFIEILLNFIFMGAISFGGGYTLLVLIKEKFANGSIFSLEEFANFIAISESTPGPIVVNISTFIGMRTYGILAAIIFTFAVILPAFLIILLYVKIGEKFLKNKNVEMVLDIVKPCIMGMIFATGLNMLFNMLDIKSILINKAFTIYNIKAIEIMLTLILVSFIYKKFRKKKLSTIKYIVIAGVVGIIL